MKRSIFVLLFAFTALFFTACSSSDDDGGGGGAPTPLSITAQPQDGEYAKGVAPTIKPLSVAAAGGSGEITYQWYSKATENAAGAEISGATEKTYTPTSAQIDTSTYGSRYFYVVVADDSETVTSRVAVIDIAELITSADDLAAIDVTDPDKVYKLTSDINLDVTPHNVNPGWTPIGSSAVPFKGTFKGGNKTISGLFISGTADDIGLFGYLGEGAKVSDVTVTLHNTGISGRNSVGGLAGYAKGTTGTVEIKNVHVKDNDGDGIKAATTSSTNLAAGGIVGQLAGSVKIIGSSNSVAVSVSTTGTAYSGGIVGLANPATPTDDILDSFNTGLVKAVSASYNTYAGGIIGSGGRAIERCYNSGTVEITSSNGSSHAGGIIGNAIAGTSIRDTYNTGEISSNTKNNAYAGGIAAYQADGSAIRRSYNRGEVNAVSTSSATYHAYVGGITGSFSTGTNYTLTNSVAANEKLSATPGSSGTAYINRILGNPLTSSATLLRNNLALSTMTVTVSGSDNTFDDDAIVNYGTDKTAAELKQKATYTGIGWAFGEDNDNSWDDSNPWKIDTKISAYPVLYWQK